MARAKFPTPVAGSFYPIYNQGKNQYIPPSPAMPFDKISALFVAFAHAYPAPGPNGDGGVLELEHGQDAEHDRLLNLVAFARKANPDIKILISLGWAKNDWNYIDNDFKNKRNLFVPSVIALIRKYGLDGFDIDWESVGNTSGSISPADFAGVIGDLRAALDAAAAQDGKPYFLTITPAQPLEFASDVTALCFDLINVQSYFYRPHSVDVATRTGYPLDQITWGISTEEQPGYPTTRQRKGLAGMFNWSLSADHEHRYENTVNIAKLVGYPPRAKGQKLGDTAIFLE